jgi:hypothetical protein
MVGFGEAKPPQESSSALVGGSAADQGGRKIVWRDVVPPILPAAGDRYDLLLTWVKMNLTFIRIAASLGDRV